MKKMLIIFLLLSKIIFSQEVSLATYDNLTAVDNYWGEIDSLILFHKISVVETYKLTDSLRLQQIAYYKDGRKTRVEEGYLTNGEIERLISYRYSKNRVEANLIHYPSRDNYSRFPARRYGYLLRYEGNNSYPRYKPDSTGRVIMKMRHTWLSNGDIFFESFDRDESLMDTLTLHKIASTERHWKTPEHFPLKTGVGTVEERHYNESGNLEYIKDCRFSPCTESKYTYDTRALLTKIETLIFGKFKSALVYKYY